MKEEFRGIKDQISGWEDIHVAQLLSQKQRTEMAIATLQDLPTSTSISNRKLKPPELDHIQGFLTAFFLSHCNKTLALEGGEREGAPGQVG